MLAIRRPLTLEPAGLAGPVAFALGALLLAVAFAAALSRSGTSVPATSVAFLIAFAIAFGALAFLRDNAAERLLQVYIFLIPVNFFLMGDSFVSIERSSFGFRMSAADLVFPALVLVLIRRRMDAGSPLRTRTMLLFLALLLALTVSWAQSTFYLGGLSSYSTGKYAGLVYLVLFCAVAVEVLRDRSGWRRTVDTLALSGALCGLVGIAGWMAYRFAGNGTFMDGDRLSSTMWGDPNIFGSLLAVSFVISLMNIRFTEGRIRWLWVTCVAITLIALVLSQSRSGTLAAGLGVVVLACAYRPALVLTIATMVAGIVAMLWSLNVLMDLPVNVGSGGGIWHERRFSTDTIDSRTQFWEKGVRLLPTEGLAGIGIGSFEQINFVQETSGHDFGYVRAHNSYLAAVLELGITGTLALLLFSVAILGAVRDGYRHLGFRDRWRLSGVVAAMAGLMLFALFVDTLYQRHLWVLIALLLAVPNILGTPSLQPAEDEE
jgi:O-antigen ligase